MAFVPVKVRRLHPAASLPEYATEGSMCFDLRVCEPGGDIVIHPGQRLMVNTGLAFEMPPGWGMNVYSRSGHGARFGVALANGTGKVDPDYRGEVYLCVSNNGSTSVTFKHGDRIAQAEPVLVHRAVFNDVQKLSDTERGAKGFGSTGDAA